MTRKTSWIGDNAPGADAFRSLFDIAVVIPTILRPGLLRAVRSIYAQDHPQRIQILIGIDRPEGDPGMLDTLQRECPDNMALCVMDLGHSSAVKHGGLYSCNFGGALRTILSYAAHAEHVAYLDDDNWFAPDHLSSLRKAVDGHDWAFSYRFFVNPVTSDPICPDAWESLGPGHGIFKSKANGFADPNTLLLHKIKCHNVLPYWSIGPFKDGRGSDRIVFDQLQMNHSWKGTGQATAFYRFSETDQLQDLRLKMFRSKGIERIEDPAGNPAYVRQSQG